MTFDEFLSAYDPDVQHLARLARRLILDVIPSVIEQVDPPSKLAAYSVGPKMADTVCTIHPFKSAVNLGIYRAVDLPDPAGLLEGTGKLHRHIRLRAPVDLDNPALRALLAAALAAKKTK